MDTKYLLLRNNKVKYSTRGKMCRLLWPHCLCPPLNNSGKTLKCAPEMPTRINNILYIFFLPARARSVRVERELLHHGPSHIRIEECRWLLGKTARKKRKKKREAKKETDDDGSKSSFVVHLCRYRHRHCVPIDAAKLKKKKTKKKTYRIYSIYCQS